MGNLTPASFCLLLFSITLGSFGQICLKLGLRGHHIAVTTPLHTFQNIFFAMLSPWVMVGLGLYVISTLTWIMLISRVRLSIAYPMISISYILVMVLSVAILHEKIAWGIALAALICIGIGVSFIGLGLGQSAEKQQTE